MRATSTTRAESGPDLSGGISIGSSESGHRPPQPRAATLVRGRFRAFPGGLGADLGLPRPKQSMATTSTATAAAPPGIAPPLQSRRQARIDSCPSPVVPPATRLPPPVRRDALQPYRPRPSAFDSDDRTNSFVDAVRIPIQASSPTMSPVAPAGRRGLHEGAGTLRPTRTNGRTLPRVTTANSRDVMLVSRRRRSVTPLARRTPAY